MSAPYQCGNCNAIFRDQTAFGWHFWSCPATCRVDDGMAEPSYCHLPTRHLGEHDDGASNRWEAGAA